MDLDQLLPARLRQAIETGRWQAVARPANVWSLVDEARVEAAPDFDVLADALALP